MKDFTASEINRLQNNLMQIRNAGGWSAEEFGNMIGVTKQTISNLESKKTIMSKTQYIAIRAVLDYEISERPNDKLLISTVNLCLNAENLTDADIKKAQAFIAGATKTGLDDAAMADGLAALIGMIAAEAILLAPTVSSMVAGASVWLSKIIKTERRRTK